MSLAVLVALLVGMVSDDLGRSTGSTLRASFIAFPVAVMALGVLPCQDFGLRNECRKQ